MIKKIIISASLLMSLSSFAQEGTSSPYSFYGIGDVRFKGTAEMRSMGGIAVEQDSIHINLENPASFSNLKLTTFTIGGNYNSNTLKSDKKSENARSTTLDYLAVGLPLGKMGVGFGLIPYSSVGYKIETLSSEDGGVNKRYNGSGGLNKVFLGLAYNISSKFSLGADANYNFGKIDVTSLEYTRGVVMGTREVNSSELSGVNFNFGAMYQTKIAKKMSLYTSLTYSLEHSLSSQNTRDIATGPYDSEFNFSATDSFDQEKSDDELKFPSKITFGAGIGETKKWLIGGRIAYQDAADLENSYNESNNVSYGKYASLSLGGYYIPDYNSFTSYGKRVVYRGGLKYEKTGLVINSESINNMGLTLGAGLPISGSFSSVNLGVEFGKRGTTSSGLIQENYINFSVGFSFNDKWFVKRKFN
jgi:long-subunit fatty acid transport protein